MAAVGGVGTALVSGNRVKNPSLGLELIAMSEETSSGGFLVQQTADGRGGFTRASIPNPEDIAELMKTADQLVQEHTARLKEIVEQYGWPSKRLVGFDGAHAAFQLLQQTNDRVFRFRALSLMKKLPPGQVDGDDLARVTDRVATEQGDPQTYGTQVACNRDTGQIEVVGGIADEANVDKRRAEIGLPPLSVDLDDARFAFGGCEIGN